jgi:hypothetical protein
MIIYSKQPENKIMGQPNINLQMLLAWTKKVAGL